MWPSKYLTIVVVSTVIIGGAVTALVLGKDVLAGSMVALGLVLAKALGGNSKDSDADP